MDVVLPNATLIMKSVLMVLIDGSFIPVCLSVSSVIHVY